MISLGAGVIFYSSRRSGGSDHNGGRGKNEIPSGMVVVGLGVDEKSDGLRGELFDGLQNKERIGRVGAAIDQHDSFLGDDDAAIGSGISPLNVASAVDINSLSDFQEVRLSRTAYQSATCISLEWCDEIDKSDG